MAFHARGVLLGCLSGALFPTARALAASRVGEIPFVALAGDLPQRAGERGAGIFEKELKPHSDFEVVPRKEALGTHAANALFAARAQLAKAGFPTGASCQGSSAWQAAGGSVTVYERHTKAREPVAT